jgi:hypothetical protein
MTLVVYIIMTRRVDMGNQSVDVAIASMFTMLAVASFSSALAMKSSDWHEYRSVVQSVAASAEYPDGREVQLLGRDLFAELEPNGSDELRRKYLCAEQICHKLRPGDAITVQRKWAGPKNGWLIQEVKIVSSF